MSQYPPPPQPGQHPWQPPTYYPPPYQQPVQLPQGYPPYPQQPIPYPPSSQMHQPSPQKPKKSGTLWLVIAALFIGGIIGYVAHVPPAASNSGTSVQPTAPSGWSILKTFTGNGPDKTELFSVPTDWKIAYACYGFANGFQGAVAIQVMGADNSYVDPNAVNVICPGNTTTSAFTEEHNAGQVYLSIIAAGQWSVQVQVPK